MLIKKIINYYNINAQKADKLISNSKYLASGKYKFNKTLKYIFLDNDVVAQTASHMFDRDDLLDRRHKSVIFNFLSTATKAIIRNSLNRKLKIESRQVNDKTNFQGTILIFAAKGKNIDF